MQAYLNDIQVEEHSNSGTNFVLEAMHFEAHPLEDNFRTGSIRNLFEDGRDLCRIDGRRR